MKFRKWSLHGREQNEPLKLVNNQMILGCRLCISVEKNQSDYDRSDVSWKDSCQEDETDRTPDIVQGLKRRFRR